MVFLSALFLIGLAFGSFLNNYAVRFLIGKSVWGGRSKCPHCKHELGPLDLIPLVSFLWLRGRCWYCRKPISWQYPGVELVTGLLFVGVGVLSGAFKTDVPYLLSLVFYLYLVLVAVAVSIVDFRVQLIPDRIILPAAIVVALYHLGLVLLSTATLTDCWVLLGAALGAGLFLYAVAWAGEKIFGQEAMGGGDIKLGILIGLIVGWPNAVWAFILAFWVAAIVGVALIVLGKRKMADRIPFGPYLIVGAGLALVIGHSLTTALLPSL